MAGSFLSLSSLSSLYHMQSFARVSSIKMTGMSVLRFTLNNPINFVLSIQHSFLLLSYLLHLANFLPPVISSTTTSSLRSATSRTPPAPALASAPLRRSFLRATLVAELRLLLLLVVMAVPPPTTRRPPAARSVRRRLPPPLRAMTPTAAVVTTARRLPRRLARPLSRRPRLFLPLLSMLLMRISRKSSRHAYYLHAFDLDLRDESGKYVLKWTLRSCILKYLSLTIHRLHIVLLTGPFSR